MTALKESKIKKSFYRFREFFLNDIWDIEASSLNAFYRGCLYIYKILALTIKDFIKNRCTLWAASITYYTLLSFVPITAVILFIAKVFNLYNYILSGVLSIVNNYAPSYEPLIRQIFAFIKNMNVSSYGLVGIIATVISMILLLMNIQKCLMTIWNVKRTVSFPRLIADYIALMLLLPILLGLSFALVAYSRLAVFLLPPAVRFSLAIIAPIAALWFIILLFYVLIPPTKVLWRGAVVSSLITATVIIIILNIYFKFNIGLDKYKDMFDNQLNYIEYTIESIENTDFSNSNSIDENDEKIIRGTSNIPKPYISILRKDFTKIKSTDNNTINIEENGFEELSYSIKFESFSDAALEQLIKYSFRNGDHIIITYENGTLLSITPQSFSPTKIFVQIPILLILLYVCSLIILFGAELNHSYQSIRLYSRDISNFNMSFHEKEIIALTMISDIAVTFLNKSKPLALAELAENYKISPDRVQSILKYFEDEGYIISFVNNRIPRYALAFPPENIKISALLKGFRKHGANGQIQKISNIYYTNLLEDEKKLSKITLMDAIKKSNNI